MRQFSGAADVFSSVSFLVRREPDDSLALKARLHQCEARLHQRRRRVFTSAEGASSLRAPPGAKPAHAHFPIIFSATATASEASAA